MNKNDQEDSGDNLLAENYSATFRLANYLKRSYKLTAAESLTIATQMMSTSNLASISWYLEMQFDMHEIIENKKMEVFKKIFIGDGGIKISLERIVRILYEQVRPTKKFKKPIPKKNDTRRNPSKQ